MAPRTWTVYGVDQENFLPDGELTDSDLNLPGSGCKISKRRLRGGLSDGVDVIHVDNGKLKFDILPTRGMSLWKAWLGEIPIGWDSPVRGPVHPSFVPLMEPSGLGWLDGFDELLVRCGLESNGPPVFDSKNRLVMPLHGRIGNRPAHRVDITVDSEKEELRIVGEVEETRFHFFKVRQTSEIVTRRGESGLRIQDRVENLSASPTEVQLLYHINFGQPLLEAGSQFVAPVKRVSPRNARAREGLETWDRYAGPVAGFEEQVYFLELLGDGENKTRVLLHNAARTRGASLEFNLQQLPCFTLWKNTTAEKDGYVTGLEPGTNYPNPRSFEGQHRRFVKLNSGEYATFELGMDFFAEQNGVKNANAAIDDLRSAEHPWVDSQPPVDRCAP
jgi:hypothetical protein